MYQNKCIHNIIRKSYVDINLGSGSGGSSGGGPSKSVGPVKDAASELLNVPVTPNTKVNHIILIAYLYNYNRWRRCWDLEQFTSQLSGNNLIFP